MRDPREYLSKCQKRLYKLRPPTQMRRTKHPFAKPVGDHLRNPWRQCVSILGSSRASPLNEPTYLADLEEVLVQNEASDAPYFAYDATRRGLIKTDRQVRLLTITASPRLGGEVDTHTSLAEFGSLKQKAICAVDIREILCCPNLLGHGRQ